MSTFKILGEKISNNESASDEEENTISSYCLSFLETSHL
jgi:hypothetical protein